GDVGGLLVGALHQPYATAVRGEPARVLLGAVQVRLDHAAGLRDVPAQLLVDGEHRVEGGVVLGVQGDGGADGGRGLDDRADVGERQVVAAGEGLAEHGQLHGHLDAVAQLQRGQPLDPFEVGATGRPGLGGRGDVLADDVHRQLQAV